MGLPNFDESIWEVALECALRRKKYHTCRHEFDDKECWECKHFLRRFLPSTATEPQIELFIYQADSEACSQVHARRGRHFGFAAIIIVCLWLAWVTYKADRRVIPQAASRTQVVVKEKPSKEEQVIWETLEKTAQSFREKVDVNGDGETNCIDAAVLFYQYYPDKDKVWIVSNAYLSHLFNYVFLDGGGFITVEPQTVYAGDKKFDMKYVWGDDYQALFDTPRTDHYKKYVR